MSGGDLQTLEDMDMQIIEFSDSEDVACKTINRKNTTIYGSEGTHNHGSSSVKLKNIVDYKWEVKHYPGRLIAAHRDGSHVAYVINVGAKGGMVRVVEMTSSARALIKIIKGQVLDLEFSTMKKKVLLAVIDKVNLFVHEIVLCEKSLRCQLLLKIHDPATDYISGYDRIIWCPYVNRINSDTDSDEEEEEEVEPQCWYIAWSRGHTFQCFDVKSPLEYHKLKEATVSQLKELNYCVGHTDPKMTITTMAMSPDASTLALGTLEGVVRFYQIYMYDENVRCLHEWNPHNKPVSSLFFLDDINRCRTEIYWNYAITGANNNTEFKVWNCSEWTCEQTVYLSSKSEDKKEHIYLAELDPSALYMVVSCFDLRTIYVFQIHSHMHEYIKKNTTIISVSEFPMQTGILSFSLGGNDHSNCKACEFSDGMGNWKDSDCVTLHMFIVQPKSMQECRIWYWRQKSQIEEEEEALNISSNPGASRIAYLGLNDNESSDTAASPPTVRSISTASKAELNDSLSPHVISTSHRNSAQLEHSSEKKPDANVSSDVFNTILLLASVAGQTPNSSKADCKNLVNNKVIEDQEHKKQQLRKSLEKEKPFVAIDNHPERHLVEHAPSGSSSPSREVQEILSWQQSFSSDNEEVQKTTVIDLKLNENETMKPASVSSKPTSSGLQNAANLIAQVVQNSNNNINNNHNNNQQNNSNSTLEDSIHETDSSNCHKINDEQNIHDKIDLMLDLIKKQSNQINTLQQEVIKLKNVKSVESRKMNELSFQIEMKLSKLLDQYLNRYEAEHKKKLTAFMAGREVQNIELRDNILQVLNQYILTQFGDVASKVIIFEIQRQLVPLINGKIDNLQQQLQIDVNQKFNAFDMMVKEHIIQVCKNKGFIETFGKSVLGGVQGSLQTAFVESMSGTLIPAYEKASQNMFKQLHDAFHSGIKEFMEQFEVYLQHLKPQESGTEQIMQTVASVQHVLDETLLKQQHVMAEAIIENRKDIKTMEILLQRHITETIKHELKKCFDQQTTTLRSQASTPAPMMYDMRENIRTLLQQGQINRAFHQALLADDLSLVEYTLKTADHNAVFIPQCCLEQKVLLSLINQISADMSTHNEIKQNYLTEALLAINPTDPITREHAPKVLQELYRNCQKFLVNFPKSPQCSNVRMLMKGVHSYIEQF